MVGEGRLDQVEVEIWWKGEKAMIQKIKDWLFQGVIVQKVIGKFVKHAIGGLVAVVAAHPVIAQAGVTIDWAKLETWAIPVLTGLFGSAWNYVEHRFVKKA